MQRLINAFRNSLRAFRRLIATETAFQQEVALLLLSLPVGWFVASSWSGYALLVGSVVALIVVEVLNTGIEAACDAIGREFNIDIQLAKDCGSLAVLLTILLVSAIWIVAVVERLAGLPA